MGWVPMVIQAVSSWSLTSCLPGVVVNLAIVYMCGLLVTSQHRCLVVSGVIEFMFTLCISFSDDFVVTTNQNMVRDAR